MPTTPAKDKTTGSVNFKSSTPTSENAVGLGISTYGANALGSTAQRDAEKALDARYVRIPVGYRDGRVTTSAAGAGTTLDVAALVKQYQSWGYRVIAVIGGRTNDFDVQAGDTTRIIQSLGTKGIDYTSPNEPGNLGKSITDSISMSKIIVAEGKAIDPNFKLGGPVWAWPSIGDVVTYGKAIGAANLGVSDWHHYAMGTNSISTEQAMAETAQYAANVNEARTRLRAEGLPDRVVIDEMNFSWRYADGTAPIGNNDRFYTAVNTVWTASALGQVLKAGGSGLIYSSQNGPLGVMVESGNRDGGRAGSSPMPAYWGITAWTGADLFPHMTDTLYATASSDPKVETYAVSNEAGGTNVVLVNKSETRTVEHTVDLNGFAGSATLWQTDPAQPFDAPKKLSQGAVVAGTAVVNLPPMSVSVVVLT